jgi:hypothetical protein
MTTPMSAERFVDRIRFNRDQPQPHRSGQREHDEHATWAITFSEQPPQPLVSSDIEN